MTVSVAVVVCSRDRPEQLGQCLASMNGQGADDLLVVDSASTGRSTEQAAVAAGARIVRVAVPGLARARNAGLRATTADVVAFTDDDCRATPGWVAAIRTAFGDPATGVVTGRVTATGAGPPLSVRLDTEPAEVGPGGDPSGLGHGASLAVRRTTWQALGGFDEQLGVGGRLLAGEDTDLLDRAVHAGWRVRYEPTAEVVHAQWRGRAGAVRTSFGYGVGAGAVHVKVRRLNGRAVARTTVAGRLRPVGRQVVADARHAYLSGVAVGLARAAGIVVGRARAARLPLDHGHLQPPDPR